jgi:hypothetical protein
LNELLIFDYPVHKDSTAKAFTNVLYVSQNGDGTRLYKDKDGQPEKLVDWKENRIVSFKPDSHTWHDYYSTHSGRITFNLVFVKKDYDYLASLGHKLQNSVDFGMWGVFAVWILKGLQYFFTWFPNYGVSIILLTFLIRMITFPLQYKSIVSMKKLQLVQP